MKLKIFIITVFIALQSTTGSAQKPGTEKGVRFHSINQVGILAGISEANLQLQSVNGIQHKTGFVGLGVGLDYYYARSIPVFIDLRKDIFNKPITPLYMLMEVIIFPGHRIKMKNLPFGKMKKQKAVYIMKRGLVILYRFLKKRN